MPSIKKAIRMTRRHFVAAGTMGGAAVAVGCTASNHGSWDFLDDAQSRTLAAICDQIVPADDFPSASQAGVVTYIDRQLARHYRRHRDTYRDGLAQAEEMSRKRFGREPAALAAPQQVELAGDLSQQNPEFFNLVRSHTLEGYYGAPRHGGNRDAVSWRMLGVPEPPVCGRAQYGPGKGPA